MWRIASEILAAKITNGLCSGTLLTLVERVISFDDIAEEGDGVSRDVRWDASLPGFGVRIYPSGKKTFVLSYREAGRKRLMTLGAYWYRPYRYRVTNKSPRYGELGSGCTCLVRAHIIGIMVFVWHNRNMSKDKSSTFNQ